MQRAAQPFVLADGVRAALLGLLAAVVMGLPGVAESAPLSPAMLIALGFGSQGLMWVMRYLAQRVEQQQGLEGALLPIATRVGSLLADGLSVLLVALAVWRGLMAPLQSI